MDEFAAELRRCFDRDRPDVVHSHFWMSGYAAFAAAGSVHAPLVHTFHALGTVKRRHQGPDDHSPPERIGLERQLLRHADRIVATCADEVGELRHMDGAPCTDAAHRTSGNPGSSACRCGFDACGDAGGARITVVPCGYDARVFRPEGQRLPRSDRPLLAAVGRLVPRKGLDVVLHALARLPEADLVIAGGPPLAQLLDDPYHRELRTMADELGLGSRVRFVGGVRPSAIAAIDRTADLFVAAPRYEPFGIAPVEAMACGTPVVATAVGGMLDTVVDGGTGALVPPDDPDALAGAARALLEAPARLATAGERAAWRTRRRYSWVVVARAMEEVYREVTSGERGGRGGHREQGEPATGAAWPSTRERPR
jgi:glycosyltransferase involved in cell wall biosynthesis